jgi:hypothetical protein
MSAMKLWSPERCPGDTDFCPHNGCTTCQGEGYFYPDPDEGAGRIAESDTEAWAALVAERRRREQETAWPEYDVEEMSVLARMKKIMKEKHGYESDDFDGMSFTDIESMFLDDCGEKDFR